jgi:UDP-N-acetylmuramate dehydrogenase
MLLWQENASLKNLNTFGMEVKAEWLVSISSKEELLELIQDARWRTLPRLILGGGSNILFTQDVKGVVARMEWKGIQVKEETAEAVWVEVQAGEVWHEWVLNAIGKGWGGIENLSLIPGSVGASPMQNIGAYGVEIKDVFVELKAVHVDTGEERIFSHEACKFGYRESIFKREEKGNWIITSVTFLLSKHPILKMDYGDIKQRLMDRQVAFPTIADISEAVCTIRQSKLPDPRILGNAGSFFKNPVVERGQYEDLIKVHPDMPHYPVNDREVKVPAGWLIERAGWKGKQWEHCAVHDRQALVLVNHNGAKGSEIWDLSTAIVEDIQQKFGILLEREVNIY